MGWIYNSLCTGLALATAASMFFCIYRLDKKFNEVKYKAENTKITAKVIDTKTINSDLDMIILLPLKYEKVLSCEVVPDTIYAYICNNSTNNGALLNTDGTYNLTVNHRKHIAVPLASCNNLERSVNAIEIKSIN